MNEYGKDPVPRRAFIQSRVESCLVHHCGWFNKHRSKEWANGWVGNTRCKKEQDPCSRHLGTNRRSRPKAGRVTGNVLWSRHLLGVTGAQRSLKAGLTGGEDSKGGVTGAEF